MHQSRAIGRFDLSGNLPPLKTDKKRAIRLSGVTFPIIAKIQVFGKHKTPIYQRFTKKGLNQQRSCLKLLKVPHKSG